MTDIFPATYAYRYLSQEAVLLQCCCTSSWGRKLALILLITLVTTLSYNEAYAWSGAGHRAIGERVLEQLDPKIQNYYLTLAQDFTAKRQSKYKARDAFISLSSWPDEIRNIPVGELFQKFNAPLPKELKPFAKASSGRWHYFNTVSASDNARCKFVNQGQLLSVMPAIDKALRNANNRTQEALLLAFQLHFIQDLHQPLHTLTRLDQRCDSDLGGNAVCLVPYEAGNCPMNLHRLWDQGFGLFDDKEGLSKLTALNVSPVNVSVTTDRAEPFLFAPKAWGQESFKYYEDVYRYKSDGYNRLGHNIVSERVKKAISRQVNYLVKHYATKHR